jgi:hypothetical protein
VWLVAISETQTYGKRGPSGEIKFARKGTVFLGFAKKAREDLLLSPEGLSIGWLPIRDDV